MQNLNISKKQLCEIVKEAGHIGMKLRQQGLMKFVKTGKDDFATQADIEISKFIHRQLLLIFPQIFFIDEENKQESYELNSYLNNKTVAVIDPIDGTTNFSQGNNNWAISIAIIHNSLIHYGVIYQPETQKFFFAKKGKGASLNDKSIHTSSAQSFNKSIVTFDYPYKIDKNEFIQTKDICKKMIKDLNIKKIYRLGSQVLEIMEVAMGRADFFFHLKTKPWDVAAAILIIRESGGQCFNKHGDTYRLFEENILITNGQIKIEKFVKLLI